MTRRGLPTIPDLREPWQIEQAALCGCKGTDEYCPCQNVRRAAEDSPCPKAPPMTAEPLDLDRLEQTRAHQVAISSRYVTVTIHELGQLISSARELEGLREALTEIRPLAECAVRAEMMLNERMKSWPPRTDAKDRLARIDAALSPSDAGGGNG